MNRSAYQHSIYAAAWSLDHLNNDGSATNQIPEQEVLRFDRLPFTGERIQLSKVIYRDSLRLGNSRVRANGADGPRFFLINLTSGTTASGYSAQSSRHHPPRQRPLPPDHQSHRRAPATPARNQSSSDQKII
jgi:hypothetical protein